MKHKTLKAFWQDGKHGVEAEKARPLELGAASDAWSDLRGKKRNFFGLIDDDGNTVQFYFDESIPDHVDDAEHLDIVSLDIPVPSRGGSFSARVTIGAVSGHIETAFREGIAPERFGKLVFTKW